MEELFKKHMMPELIHLNPYNLREGEPNIRVRITCDYIMPGEIYPYQWQGEVLLRPDIGRHWESIGIDAYQHAKEIGDLKALKLSLCHFSYYDDATESWVPFLEDKGAPFSDLPSGLEAV